ncbi:hypothetical protein MTO96_039634 [Rhipicephalus appendiculatus]
MWHCMKEVIRVWKTNGKVKAVVTDNACHDIKEMYTLQRILEGNDVSCSARSLHLSIKKELSDKDIDSVSKKIGKLVLHLRDSTIASDELSRRHELLGLPTERPTQSFSTRRSST